MFFLFVFFLQVSVWFCVYAYSEVTKEVVQYFCTVNAQRG